MRRPQVRDAVQVQVLFLFFGFAIAAFFPFLSLYYREHHGLGEAQIGVIIMVAGIARTVANPLWGHFSDTRLGRVLVLQIGLLGAVIAALWLNLVDGLVLVAAATALHSVFFVSLGPNIDAIALVHLGDGRLTDYGRIRGWESVTYAGGCLGFGLLLQAFGMSWAMPLFAVSSVAVLAWTITIPRDEGRALDHASKLGAVGAVFREAPRFWGFLAAVFLVWTGFNAAWNFIALKIDDAGGGPLLIGVGAAFGGLLELPTMRISSKLHGRWGLRKVYAAGCAIYAVGFALWGAVDDATLLSFLTFLEGVGFSLLFTTGVAVVGRLLPTGLYSTGSSVMGMVGASASGPSWVRSWVGGSINTSVRV